MFIRQLPSHHRAGRRGAGHSRLSGGQAPPFVMDQECRVSRQRAHYRRPRQPGHLGPAPKDTATASRHPEMAGQRPRSRTGRSAYRSGRSRPCSVRAARTVGVHRRLSAGRHGRRDGGVFRLDAHHRAGRACLACPPAGPGSPRAGRAREGGCAMGTVVRGSVTVTWFGLSHSWHPRLATAPPWACIRSVAALACAVDRLLPRRVTGLRSRDG
jgi:hypothetical protein